MKGPFGPLDWAILAVYFAGTMSIGFYFRRRSRSKEMFTAAGRSLPGWVCGLSIFATYLSSVSFLALPGKAYASNWNAFAFSLSLPVATWLAVRYFMPHYRRGDDVSAYAHLERRFGVWARVYASFFYLLTQVARMGAVMYLMALPLSVMLGWDIRALIVVIGVSVTVYTFVGGVIAVIWADALQSIVLMGGALVCVAAMFVRMPGGAAQVFRIAAEHDKFSLGSFGASLVEPTFWVVLVYGLFINLQNFGIDQSYVQRYIAAGSDRQARSSVWLGGLLYVPVSALFFLIGTQLFAFYEVHPESLGEVRRSAAVQTLIARGDSAAAPGFEARADELAPTLDAAAIGDKVFPHFIGRHLPTGITGLLVAAIFSAAMSTISTSLNSSATLLLGDWYARFIRPHAGEAESMRVLHVSTVLWGALGTGVALLLIQVSSALDAWWTLSGIFGGGMLGLFLLGVLSRSATRPAAIAGTLFGLAVIAWMSISPLAGTWLPANLRSGFHAFLIPVFGTLAILLGGFLVGLMLRKNRHSVPSAA